MAEQRLNIRITAQDEASLLIKNVASNLRRIKPVLFDARDISKSFVIVKGQMDKEMRSLRRSISASFRNIGKEIASEISKGLSGVGNAVSQNVATGIEGNLLSTKQLKTQLAAARRQLAVSGDKQPLLTGPFTRAKDVFTLSGGFGGLLRRAAEALFVAGSKQVKDLAQGGIGVGKRGLADIGREAKAFLTGNTVISGLFRSLFTGGLQKRMDEAFLTSPSSGQKRSDQLKLMNQFSKQQISAGNKELRHIVSLLRKQNALLSKLSQGPQIPYVVATSVPNWATNLQLPNYRKWAVSTAAVANYKKMAAVAAGVRRPGEDVDPKNAIWVGSGLQGVNLQSIAFSAGLLGKGLIQSARAGFALRSVLLSAFTAPGKALGAFLGKLLSLRNLILGGGLIILMRRFYDQVSELPSVQVAIEPLADSFRELRERAADLFIEMVKVFGPTLIEGVKALMNIIDTFGKRVMIVLSTIGKTFYNLFNIIREAWNSNDIVTLIINAMRTGIQVMWDIIKAGTPVLVESVKYLASSMSHAFITSFLGTTKLEMAKNIEAGGLGAWLIKGFAGSWGGMDNEIELAVAKLKGIRKIESEIEETTNRLTALSNISKDSILGSITSSPDTQKYIQDLQVQLDNLKTLRLQAIEEASSAVSPIDDSSIKAKSKEFSKNFVEIIQMARKEMGKGLSETTNEAIDKLTYDFIAGIEQLKSPEATQKLSEAGKAVGETTSKGIFVGMRNGLREIRKELADTVKLGENLINGLATGIESGLNSAFESVIDSTFKVGKALKDMASSVLRQFLSIANRQAALGLTSLIGGLFTPSAPTVTNANGNVLRGGFRAFASGGIVTKPTLGLVGEGKMNEAIVPLPDGRSIPVSMNGGGNNFYVTINAIDSQSFQSALAKNGDSIMNIVVSKIATSPKARQAIGSR